MKIWKLILIIKDDFVTFVGALTALFAVYEKFIKHEKRIKKHFKEFLVFIRLAPSVPGTHNKRIRGKAGEPDKDSNIDKGVA